MKSEIPLSHLQSILDSKFGKKVWVKWEPETILLDLKEGDSISPLIREKILVLQVLNEAFNSILAMPEFFIWTVQISNNEPADFEHIILPNSLEMAWTIQELKLIAPQAGHTFNPTPELIETISYILREEGFSDPVPPFDFIPKTSLVEGQTATDTINKSIAISQYVKHMRNPERETHV